MIPIQGRQLRQNYFVSLPKKSSNLKEFAPLYSKFIKKRPIFRNKSDVQETKQKVTKVITLVWVKFSAEDIRKYFSNFSQKTGFDISCKLSPHEMHEMSNPVSEKRKKISSICCLLNKPKEW